MCRYICIYCIYFLRTPSKVYRHRLGLAVRLWLTRTKVAAVVRTLNRLTDTTKCCVPARVVQQEPVCRIHHKKKSCQQTSFSRLFLLSFFYPLNLAATSSSHRCSHTIQQTSRGAQVQRVILGVTRCIAQVTTGEQKSSKKRLDERGQQSTSRQTVAGLCMCLEGPNRYGLLHLPKTRRPCSLTGESFYLSSSTPRVYTFFLLLLLIYHGHYTKQLDALCCCIVLTSTAEKRQHATRQQTLFLRAMRACHSRSPAAVGGKMFAKRSTCWPTGSNCYGMRTNNL